MFFFRKGWDAVGGYLVHGPDDRFSKVRGVLALALPQHHSCTNTTHFKEHVNYIILYCTVSIMDSLAAPDGTKTPHVNFGVVVLLSCKGT